MLLLDLILSQGVIFGVGFMHNKTNGGRQVEESKLTPKLMD